MLKRICRRKRGKKVNRATEELHLPVVIKKKTDKPHSAFYKSGPMLAMPNLAEKNAGLLLNVKKLLSKSEDTRLIPSTLPDMKGNGSPAQDSAMASSIPLEGRTDARFDGGSFSTQNVQVTAAEDCGSCADQDPCVRARGVLVSRFHVTTTVTLPSVTDFPDLTPCQQTRVRNAIRTVLAPHEQQHVQAFRQYNGVTRTPFDVTLCRSEFNTTIQGMFNNLERDRRAAVQAASDALDPFNFTVAIDCEEPSDESSNKPEKEDVEQSTGEETPEPQSHAPVEEQSVPIVENAAPSDQREQNINS